MSKPRLLPPFPPAFLRHDMAAYYAGVSPRQLTKWVEANRVRRHRTEGGRIFLYEREALVQDVAAILGITPDTATDAMNQGKKKWQELIAKASSSTS